jgi:hypothetical protein
MATLTPRLTLSGTAAHFGSSVNLSVDDSLGCTTPFSGVSRISVGTDIQEISADLTTSQSAITYVYLKNTDGTNVVTVSVHGGTAFADLNPGEFLFIPLKGATGLKAKATGSACVLEYAYFSRS